MHSGQRVRGPFQVQPERGPLPGPPEAPSFPASLPRLRACDLEQESHMAGWVAGGGFGHPVRAGLNHFLLGSLSHTHTRTHAKVLTLSESKGFSQEQTPLPVYHIQGEGRGNEEDDSDGEDEEDSGVICHSPD